jgi:hypothetical protein
MKENIFEDRLTRREFTTAPVKAGDYRNGNAKSPIIPATPNGFVTRALLSAGPVMLQFRSEKAALQ